MTGFVRFLVTMALCTGGCGAPGVAPEMTDEEAADDKADRIDPVGDEKLGSLKVTAPPSSAGYYPAELTFQADHLGARVFKTVTLGQPLRALKGQGCLGLVVDGSAAEDCAVDIKPKSTVKYALASLRAHWNPKRLEVDLGPEAVFEVTRDQANLYVSREGGDRPWGGAPTKDTLALPGTYTFLLGGPAAAPVTRVIKQGEVVDLDLTPPEQRMTLRLSPPKSRDFPDAPTQCPAGGYGVGVELGVGPTRTVDRFVLPYAAWTSRIQIQQVDTVMTYRVFPFGPNAWLRYEVAANGSAMAIPPQPGKTVDIKLGRIDVNHVAVTREDGSTYLQAGTYTVRLRDQQDPTAFHPLPCAVHLPTQTGLDVLPGVYQVTIDYVTEEGPATQEHVVTIT